jgi:hypothetical protein
MDELEKLQDRIDDQSASWPESRQLLLYIIRGLVEKQKAQEDALNAIKLKVAFVAGGCGLVAGLIPVAIEVIGHLSWK